MIQLSTGTTLATQQILRGPESTCQSFDIARGGKQVVTGEKYNHTSAPYAIVAVNSRRFTIKIMSGDPGKKMACWRFFAFPRLALYWDTKTDGTSCVQVPCTGDVPIDHPEDG